jgi:hypothetical protein
MPFGGGLKKLANNLSFNSSKNIIDPSPHRQQVGSATLSKIIFLGGGLLDREGAKAHSYLKKKNHKIRSILS